MMGQNLVRIRDALKEPKLTKAQLGSLSEMCDALSLEVGLIELEVKKPRKRRSKEEIAADEEKAQDAQGDLEEAISQKRKQDA
jgi:hypothetical protein